MNDIIPSRRTTVASSARIWLQVLGLAIASLSMGGAALAQAFPPAIDLPESIPTVMPLPTGFYPPTVAPTASAPFLASSAWSQTLAPNVRFVILSNFNHDAVLDRETGLVWARRTVKESEAGFFAGLVCRSLVIGNRMGWRLPTMAELQSLVDPSQPVTQSVPRLPAGHPFVLSTDEPRLPYWSAETFVVPTADPNVASRWLVNLVDGSTQADRNLTQNRPAVLCVRGNDANRNMSTP
jgi:hypothetical protein